VRNRLLALCLTGIAAVVACAESEKVTDGVGGAGGASGGLSGGGGSDAAAGAPSGGSGGAGGADAGDGEASLPKACQCDEPSCGYCPMTKVVAAGGYGILATEVTNEEYATFLATQPKPALQSGACAWNKTFMPSEGWPSTAPKQPVVFVDFCDAEAYCRWARLRLCGKIGGGPNPYGDLAVGTSSQWFNACSVGGTRAYPYGATYVGAACNGADYGKGAAVDVGEATGCEGGYPSLHDMSGNVWEWEDSCNGAAGETDLCRIRGGSYSQSETALGCAADSALARSSTGKSVGFRCCE
jgi:formylglycine-generating enzyme required for sulfatase activity